MISTRFSQTRLLPGLLALILCVTAWPAYAQTPNVHAQLQRSTGFMVVNKGNGQMGYGTCFVADLDRKLLITNVHVVAGTNEVRVAFARYDINGKVVTDSGAYSLNDYINGKVLLRDHKRDLALVQMNSLPQGIKALALAPQSIDLGEPIYSIGNAGMAGKLLAGGTLWRQRSGKVKNRFFWRTKLVNIEQYLEVRVIQTDSGVQGGDSGGPIVDAQGRLVGVVSCCNKEGDYGVDVGEVRTVLQRGQGNLPAAPHPAAGAWTASWSYKGKDYYASLILNTDGTSLWEATQQFTGNYTYAEGRLTLNLPNSGINTKNNTLTWTSIDQFQFTIQYSEGPTTFTLVRR
jgi:hypothetical protein